jgi:3-deoxy-manno-octulosonate cytidylyltransferase (CMP-KDO synthetase)
MKIVCAIPARYNSSRFPGKSIQLINGIPLIKRVYDNAIKSDVFDMVFIVTWGKQIEEICKSYDMAYTSQLTDKCKCGTDAISEISKNYDADIYVNLQGDEPLIMPQTIKEFINKIKDVYGDYLSFNCVADCDDSNDLNNINIPKVTVKKNKDLLYMSRYPIPYRKSKYQPKYLKELGLHAYTKLGLEFFYNAKQQDLEIAEGIEFLRFLEYGIPVKSIHVSLPFNNHAVDIPKDICIVESIINKNIIE